MEFQVQNKISNFIENQFPDFYKEEGPNFILFVKTYYEWLESQGKPIYYSRNLPNFRDVDNTLTEFLDYFQKKYVYGIPSNVIINKRFLIKHILDVYRSKSSIEGYKLLFRIVYNEDLDVYLPGNDVLRVSDGTWKEPTYIELSYVPGIENFIGKTIVGSSSGTTTVQASAAASGTLTLPAATDTLVGRATTDTLTNKSLVDNTTYFVDDLDSTKKMQFQLSGITAATTRTLTVPNADGTIALTSDVATKSPVIGFKGFK